MPNESGVNQFDGFGTEAAQGAVKKLTSLTKAAPMSGAPVSALNTPRRAKRHATGQDRPQEQGQAQAPAMMSPPPPQITKEQIWAELAAHPEASPLVKELFGAPPA